MPKRLDINKIMVIGSGPIIIGQAAEFDYAGTQACVALKEEGYETILVNSNPATIMSDKMVADKVYMEPLKAEYVAQIIRTERPDAIIPSLGGQTGLNLVVELAQSGVLEECQVEVLGTSLLAIQKAEDRELFKQLCLAINEPIIESSIANTVAEACCLASEIGYPIILRPAYTLGGTGGGFVYSEDECLKLAANALKLSPTNQVLVEKSLKGFKEVEYEVMRDGNDTALIVCNMENIDPVGVHTGDSMVVAPSLTLTNKEYQMLRNASLKIIRALDIKGGCNVQFALDPTSKNYYVIEVNPRVSRSSALASKATGYPIAKVSTKIALGYDLDEIMLANTPASFEPALDYIVTKLARFPFDKFKDVDRRLTTQMKATGEIMALGRCFEESFLKAIRSMENEYTYLDYQLKIGEDTNSLLERIKTADDERIYIIGHLLRSGQSIKEICDNTKIDKYFITKLANIIKIEQNLELNPINIRKAKQIGLSDDVIAKQLGMTSSSIREYRLNNKIIPVYKMIDTCSNEFDAYIPYFYSSYALENDSIVSQKKSILVIGSGPIRIGQGVEFDYSTVHCIKTIQELGYEAIVVNNNPETVSTDYTISDKLYFEPLTFEEVMNIIDLEQPEGIIIQLGGQTAINLGGKLHDAGIKILGTSYEQIEACENRDLFEKILAKLSIPQPQGQAIIAIEEGLKVASKIGYPVLVRPSFILGGQAMRIINDDDSLVDYLNNVVTIDSEKPILIDKYIRGKEIEVDAVCDGVNILIPGIMEHIEPTGVHSGDSISVYPTFSISEDVINKIVTITTKVGLGLKIKGLYNIQFIVDENDNVYIIEVNPRASRSVPFISKITDINLSSIATKIMLNHQLSELGYTPGLHPIKEGRYYVKVPTFSFSKIIGLDTKLGPEMKSTGEAIGYANTLNKALYKGLQASGMKVSESGTVLITVCDEDKSAALELAKRFYALGFNIVSTKKTALYLKEYGLKVKTLAKISEGSDEILDWIRLGYINYIVNTHSSENKDQGDGFKIRTYAASNNVVTLTSLNTVDMLLTILEERGIKVDTI